MKCFLTPKYKMGKAGPRASVRRWVAQILHMPLALPEQPGAREMAPKNQCLQ